ncbi:MAG TPA: thioesterase family protein [Saprospiraceae bacterium]|nr:thioesterase family protein [Saprospiraceae bacterium]
MYSHDLQLRVRYGETDQMGYLYYGNYAQYYEIGRVEMLRASGLTYREMEQERGVLMPVVSLQMRYVRPAYYDELLTIRTTLRRLPEKFITFEVEIFNENRKLVNGGSVRLCFVDAKSGKTIAAPEFLLEKLRAHFEKAPTT